VHQSIPSGLVKSFNPGLPGILFQAPWPGSLTTFHMPAQDHSQPPSPLSGISVSPSTLIIARFIAQLPQLRRLLWPLSSIFSWEEIHLQEGSGRLLRFVQGGKKGTGQISETEGDVSSFVFINKSCIPPDPRSLLLFTDLSLFTLHLFTLQATVSRASKWLASPVKSVEGLFPLTEFCRNETAWEFVRFEHT
jgi:hypothetical protein